MASALLRGAEELLPSGLSHSPLLSLTVRSWIVNSVGGVLFIWFADKSLILQAVPGMCLLVE